MSLLHDAANKSQLSPDSPDAKVNHLRIIIDSITITYSINASQCVCFSMSVYMCMDGACIHVYG